MSPALINKGAIATLWIHLIDIYGARFVNQYGEKDTSRIWYRALCDISEEGLRLGLSAMIHDIRFETWPPNCTQFRHLCLSQLQLDALPNVYQAFAEARRNLNSARPDWSKTHRVIKFTVAHIGAEKVDNARVDIALTEFSKMYEKVCKSIMRGNKVPDVDDKRLTVNKTKSNQPPRLSLIIR